MPRVFVPPERLQGPSVELRGEAHRHLARVLRIVVGEPIGVFDGEGHEIAARVTAVSRHAVTLALGPRRLLPAPAVHIELVQAVPRGERMDLIVQKTTELGVARIVPVHSLRSPAREGDEAGARRLARWKTIARESARQCGRADIPDLVAPVGLAEGAEAAGRTGGTRLVLWEDARGPSLPSALRAASGTSGGRGDPGRLCLVVGPEGGFSAGEIGTLTELGFAPVSLGPRILRTETAAIVAVALAQAARGGFEIERSQT